MSSQGFTDDKQLENYLTKNNNFSALRRIGTEVWVTMSSDLSIKFNGRDVPPAPFYRNIVRRLGSILLG